MGMGMGMGTGIGTPGYGGYEPTSKTVSVVNSVEMNGDEKYLVVSLAWFFLFGARNSGGVVRRFGGY